MRWEWSGPDVVLAVITTAVTIVTTFASLLISTIAAVLVALWIQRREFKRETATRRQEREEQLLADRVAWRVRMADEAISYCITIQEAAMAPGDNYARIMVDRNLDALQARLRLGGEAGSDHVAIAMRRDWEECQKRAATVQFAFQEREDTYRGMVLRLQDDLRRWGSGEMPTADWAARGIGG